MFLSGDKRISELEKIESEAHSTFLKGLINYFIGMSLEHSHDERNIRILNAISIFKGTDEIRLASCLHALIQGAVDRRDDRGNPTRVVPQGNDLLEPLPRLENILKTLSDYDEEVTKIVMYEVEDYLIHRICGYRQTNRNDYPLIFQQKFQMVATVPQIRSLYNSLELLLEENSDHEIINYINRLIECLHVISLTKYAQSEINLDLENTHHPITKITAELVEKPVLVTISRYDFSKVLTDELYEALGSLVIHLSEPFFENSQRFEVVQSILDSIKEEHKNCNEIKREILLRFVIEYLDTISKNQNPHIWLSIYKQHSLITLDSMLLQEKISPVQNWKLHYSLLNTLRQSIYIPN